MKIIDTFIQAKTGNIDTCEDGYIISSDYIGVIDGTTSKNDFLYENKSPGRIAMETIQNCIKRLNPKCDIYEAVQTITDSISDWYNTIGITEKVLGDPALQCSASLVLVNINRKEVWFIGDCQALINGKYYCFPKKIDDMTTKLRQFLLESMLLHGETIDSLLQHDKARDILMPILRQQMYLANQDNDSSWSYAVLNGMPVPKTKIQCIKLENATNTIVLASDGYPKLFDTLEQSEAYLNQVLQQDPLLYKVFLSTKTVKKGNLSFDDRTYLKFEL